MCPYGRIQGVLLDVNSIIVSYDYVRGEPRGKSEEGKESGDCINCGQCVQVCPTGIDIRNGTQLECINCMACIDACDSVMDRIGKPKGLIRLASEKEISENQGFKVTPRMAGYSLLLVALIAFLSVLIFGRSDLETTILRTPGMLYQNQDDGSISNLYNVKIINKTVDPVSVEMKLNGVDGRIKMVRGDINIKPSSIFEDVFFIYIMPDELDQKKNEFVVEVYKDGKLIEEKDITFIGDKQ
jgi:cytochrome c oxidase accessory protein FixG